MTVAAEGARLHGTVLVVEDDPAIREATAMLLERAGLAVLTVADGSSALERLDRNGIDVVLLDLMLPGIDGLDVCREMRRTSQIPIVIVSARTAPDDVVLGLELGADDYVTKPFHAGELVARLTAVLRRLRPEDRGGPVRFAELAVNPAASRAELADHRLELSATEFRLLLEFARHPGTTLSRQDLLRRVWGYEYLGDSRLVDMAVKRLRSKLSDDSREPRWIATVRGVGYRFEGGTPIRG